MYKYDEAFNSCKQYFNGDELSTSTLVNKYLLRDRSDNFLENKPEDRYSSVTELSNDLKNR